MQNPTETTLALSGGQAYRVLFSYLGMMRAEEQHGFTIEGVELDPEKKPEAPEGRPSSGLLRTMLENVWIGVLSFADVSLEDLALQIRTAADMAEVGRVYTHILRYQLAQPEVVEGEPGGEPPGEGAKKKS